jgi:hypothetical protein
VRTEHVHSQGGIDTVEWLSLAVPLLVLGDEGYIMAALVEGVVDFALHCMAWMVYPDLALSVWCEGAELGIVASSERGDSG